jgi:hypothetical protein
MMSLRSSNYFTIEINQEQHRHPSFASLHFFLKKSHAKAQRRKVFPAISSLNQFNYWHLQHLVRPRITKAFLYFLFLRLGVRFLKSVNWQMKDANF